MAVRTAKPQVQKQNPSAKQKSHAQKNQGWNKLRKIPVLHKKQYEKPGVQQDQYYRNISDVLNFYLHIKLTSVFKIYYTTYKPKKATFFTQKIPVKFPVIQPVEKAQRKLGFFNNFENLEFMDEPEDNNLLKRLWSIKTTALIIFY